MLGTVLDKITSLIGRAFVIAHFFPTLLFAAVNLASSAYFGSAILTRWAGLKDFQILASISFFIVVVAAAYFLMAISPVLKRCLEDAYPLPSYITKLLVGNPRREFLKRRARVQQELEVWTGTRSKHVEWTKAIAAANQHRREKKTAAPVTSDNKKLAETTNLVETLYCDYLERGALPMAERLDRAASSIVSLYNEGQPLEQVELIHRKLMQLWDDVEHMAQSRYTQILSAMQADYALSEGIAGVRPTYLGNIMSAAWSYPYTRYGIDSTLAWPRLQKVIPKEYFQVVEDARVTYDFCVNMTFFSLLYSTIWLVVTFAALPASSPDWSHLWIPGVGIVVGALFHAATLQAARAFGQVFCSCFDLFRFTLLKELRIQLPTDIKDERTIWNRVNQILIYGDQAEDIKYVQLP
jgi:hypothetical protein